MVIVSQFKLKLYIEPAIELKKAMAEVSNELLFSQEKIGQNRDQEGKVSAELKRCSAKFRSSDSIVSKHKWFRWMFGLPETEQILEACHSLNLTANNLLDPKKGIGPLKQNDEAISEIRKLMSVATSYER